MGYEIKNRWDVNLSIGLDYIGEYIMQNNDSLNFDIQTFTNSWNPNFSIGIAYRPSKWISYHVEYIYGSTLVYLENAPRKQQFNYGFRIAPFYKNKRGLLRNMRIELVAINAYFPDIKCVAIFPPTYFSLLLLAMVNHCGAYSLS